jgi:endonuclease/exonuclease/phosphatase family metal-dependent hydrolase
MGNPRENIALEALGIMTRLSVLEHEGYDYLIRNRVAHRVRVEVDGSPLDFWNTHFHHEPDELGNKMRSEQAEKLSTWIESHSARVPSVLVGDFNCIPGTRPIRTIATRLRSVFDTLGREAPKTVPTPLETKPYPGNWAIDHIFASPGVRILDAVLAFDEPDANDGTLYCCDHFGLTATIDFGEPA